MADVEHSALHATANQHAIHRWAPADQAARFALVVVSGDRGKVAWQLSDNTFWILRDHTAVGNANGWRQADDSAALAAAAAALAAANEADDTADAAQATANAAAPQTRTLTAGSGLTGGGDLSANRSFACDFGSGAGKVCQGNDSRLSDARTPTAHAASHKGGGSDVIDNAVAGGAAGLMSGTDKTKLDGIATGALSNTDSYPLAYSTTTTDGDPGAGGLRMDSTTMSSVTRLYVDLVDSRGLDLTSFLDNMLARGGGAIKAVHATDPSKFVILALQNWITASGYRKLVVKYVIHNGTLSNSDAVLLQFISIPDWIGRGTDLTDADQTLTPTATVAMWIMRPGVTTAARAKTAGTLAAGRCALFAIYPQGHDVTIVNGGSGGGTIHTVSAGDAALICVRYDGTNYPVGARLPLA